MDVAKLLAQLTLLDMTEVADIAAEHLLQPGRRTGQRRLAFEVTALVHGQQAAKDAAGASAVLFGDSPVDAPLATLEMLRSEVPTWSVGRERLASGMDAIDALLESDLATSRSDARRTLEQNGFVMNGARLEVGATLGVDSLLHGRFLLLRRGKANYRLVVVE